MRLQYRGGEPYVNPSYILQPNEVREFSDDEAQRLLKDFPHLFFDFTYPTTEPRIDEVAGEKVKLEIKRDKIRDTHQKRGKKK